MFEHTWVLVQALALFAALVALYRWLWYDYMSAKQGGKCQHDDAAAIAVLRKANLVIDPMSPITTAESTGNEAQKPDRCRLRDLGVVPGLLPTGPNNAITDAGVLVGHTTIRSGEGVLVAGKGPVRTGVTVVVPHKGDLWQLRPSAGHYVLNGNGCVTGLDWMKEAGLIEGPIGLTNTHSVGDVYKGIISWMQERYPEIGIDDTTMPVVGECDDSGLSDIRGFHVTTDHVLAALRQAKDGPVAEGAVGAGTGMTSFQFKGGIGTASRVARVGAADYTVGVLVNCNNATRGQLQIMGVPVGRALEDEMLATRSTEGSIVIVVATDAPLSPRQCERIAKRASLGLAITGATANTASGDFVIAFSNTRLIPREHQGLLSLPELSDGGMNPLFQATVEATAEAVWNALCKAETVVGRDGNISPALPLDRVRELLAVHGLVAGNGPTK